MLALLGWAGANGAPFVYPDTQAYLHLGEGVLGLDSSAPVTEAASVSEPKASRPVAPEPDVERLVPAPPSLYYGALAALPVPLPRPWTAVLLQAFFAAALLRMALRALAGPGAVDFLPGLAAALALGTPLGLFIGLVMPDVWVGLMVLGVALLVSHGERLSLAGRALAFAVAAGGAAVHPSHLAVLLLLVPVAFALRRRGPRAPAWLVLGAAGAGLLAHGAQSAVLTRHHDARLVRPPHLTAHLIDAGPGMRLIDERCPELGLDICTYREGLPVEWREFLFVFPYAGGATPAQRRLADEDFAFARATLAHDPWGVVSMSVTATAWQLVRVGLTTAPIRASIGESGALATFPDGLREDVVSGRLYEADAVYALLEALFALVLLVALLVLGAGLLGRGPARALATEGDIRRFAGVVMTGLVANAAVCGILASPYARFQARIAWLLPATVALLVLATRHAAAGSAPQREHHSREGGSR